MKRTVPLSIVPGRMYTSMADPLALQLRTQAAEAAQEHWHALKITDWTEEKGKLRDCIITHAGIQFYPELPLLLKETNHIQLASFSIKALRFQTLPGIFATASLYIPIGAGPFPGIVLTHGHWEGGRNSSLFQEVAQNIVRNGYVCLTIDAWGAGERSSTHGIPEYHGNNLGASLLNIGKTLLGMQVTENIRAVDLLCTLPMVDHNNLGATGASGGGNQAMWLAAIDERIKAAVPVVSVGTFRSYMMNSNCVCELLPSGLTFTEEAGVLALIAPRALRMINAKQETNPSFTPEQLLLSYQHALPIFEQFGVADRIDYKLVDGGHGYDLAMQKSAITWFDMHLKPPANKVVQPGVAPGQILETAGLETYQTDRREAEVCTTMTYCIREGRKQRDTFVHSAIDPEKKQHLLRQLLGLPEEHISQVTPLPTFEELEHVEITASTGYKLSVVFSRPENPERGYVIVVHGYGQAELPQETVSTIRKSGQGVILFDLWGTGSRSSREAMQIDGSLSPHHTLSRSLLWLGRTMMGQWAGELLLLMQWVQTFTPHASVHLIGFREAGLAALYTAPFGSAFASITTIDAPVSYLFDTLEGVNYYNMSVHVPGILSWGDIGLLTSLSHSPLIFRNPRTLSGNLLNKETRSLHQDYFNTIQQVVNRDVDIRFE